MTESAATTEGTEATRTTVLSEEPQNNTELVSISATITPPEAGFTLTTLSIQTESTNSPMPSDDGTVTAGDFTTVATSDTESGKEQTSTPLLDTTTGSVPSAQDDGATTPAEVTSTIVLGETHEQPASTVPHEITEQTTQTAAPTQGLTEATALTEQSAENVAPTEPTGTVSSIEQATETIAPTEQPAGTVTATEHVSERVTLTEQTTQTGKIAQTVQSVETLVPTETAVPTERQGDAVTQTEQLTETAVTTERQGDAVAQTEQPIEAVVQTELPTETAAQTEPEEKMTETGQQTETAVPTEQPAGEVTQAEQIEIVASIEQRTETLTTNTVADIVNNTIPDDALIQSMSRFRDVRRTLSTSLPLSYNLSSPATSENTTPESSNRTRRSIEGKALYFLV
jgi:hypothetical protein